MPYACFSLTSSLISSSFLSFPSRGLREAAFKSHHLCCSLFNLVSLQSVANKGGGNDKPGAVHSGVERNNTIAKFFLREGADVIALALVGICSSVEGDVHQCSMGFSQPITWGRRGVKSPVDRVGGLRLFLRGDIYVMLSLSISSSNFQLNAVLWVALDVYMSRMTRGILDYLFIIRYAAF